MYLTVTPFFTSAHTWPQLSPQKHRETPSERCFPVRRLLVTSHSQYIQVAKFCGDGQAGITFVDHKHISLIKFERKASFWLHWKQKNICFWQTIHQKVLAEGVTQQWVTRIHPRPTASQDGGFHWEFLPGVPLSRGTFFNAENIQLCYNLVA